MTNADELDAIKALAHRLTEWGVDGAAGKAKLYVADLVGHGWRMAANEARAIRRPPQKSEECATHAGEWADFCRCCVADRKAAAADERAAETGGRWDAARIRETLRTAPTKEDA